MNQLIKEVLRLKKGDIGKKVNARLEEFSSFKQKHSNDWFEELCFCLLTANSKAVTAINIQKELGFKGFSEYPEKKIAAIIRKNGHRFHNNKAHFIVLARQYLDVRFMLSGIIHDDGTKAAREWLVKNIKGMSYKEASHYLRNIGFFDLAILDRHVINLMLEYGYLKSKPKNLNKKNYLLIEDKFKKMAEAASMSIGELDMYMWYMKTGDVLK